MLYKPETLPRYQLRKKLERSKGNPSCEKPGHTNKSWEGMPTYRCHFHQNRLRLPSMSARKKKRGRCRFFSNHQFCAFICFRFQCCSFVCLRDYNILGSVFTYTLASRRNPLLRTTIYIYIYICVCICKCQIECQMGLGRF